MKHLSNVFIFLISMTAKVTQGFTIDFCSMFVTGGACSGTCNHEAVHSWGIPLCLHSAASSKPRCCIPDNHPLLQRQRSNSGPTTQVPSSTSTMTPPLTSPVTMSHAPTRACGRSRRHSRLRRVIGGNIAARDAWPWQVAIQAYTGQYLCGGVIISRRWILTAAHCFQSYNDDVQYFRVYTGSQNLSYSRDDRHRTTTISRIIKHPGFRRNVPITVVDRETGVETTVTRHIHDIALVELTLDLTLSSSTQSVCLSDIPSPRASNMVAMETESYNDCWVTGWGETNVVQNDSVPVLHEVRGEVLEYRQCSNMWGINFTDDVLCFGREGEGPCQGDSGGGLACRHDDGLFYLKGIISWGRDDCIHNNHPSVLTRVATYRHWIDSFITATDNRT